MKKRAKQHRRKDRRGSGKPPRWLVFSALAASTALGGRLTVPVHAQEAEDSSSYKALPPKRLGQLAALADATSRDPLTPADQAERSPSRYSASARRFDLPPGPLGEALDAFEKVTGLEVEAKQETIRTLATQGVHGLFTADQALRELLAGTGVTYRFTGARTVTLELSAVAETIEVTAPSIPAPASPKLTEPLRDTPQTITVVPQQIIQEQNATTLRDVLRNVTGISIQAGEGGGGIPGDNLSIRGFSATNDIFVDGIRDFGAYSRDPFNLEQVEVSKGPASLYTGHGSTGGAVNLVSKTPRLEASHSATLGGGTDSYGRVTVDVNQPLAGIAGAALRLNGMWTNADTPGRDEVYNRRWGVAPSLALGLGTATRTTLSYLRLDQDNLPEYGIPWVPATNQPLAQYANQPAPVSFDNFYGLVDRDYEKTVTDIATAAVDHDFSDALTLRSVLRWGESKRDSVITAPRFVSDTGTDLRRQLQSRDLDNDILAQQNNLTAHFETGSLAHAFTAGTELSRETGTNYARSGPEAPFADLFHPDPHAPYAGPIVRTGAYTESTAKTAALYAGDTVKLSERWEVTGGLRWDRFDVDYKSVAVDGVATPFTRTDSMLSWKAGVVNKVRPNGSVYFSAGTSFNPSAEGSTGLSLSASTADLKPEENRGYELGTKWDFPQTRLSMTAAVFQTDKTNAKTPGVNPGDPPTVLDGVQRIRGMELGVSGNLTDRWSAFFGYTYLNSRIVRSNTPAEVGNELANAPEHSGSLWTTYRLGHGFELGGGVQYVGDRLNSTTTRRLAPAYTLLDLTAAHELNSLLTLRLNVYNLTDKRYIDRVGGGHFIPGAGRSATLTAAFNF
jgi:catecholate siderophore receptor